MRAWKNNRSTGWSAACSVPLADSASHHRMRFRNFAAVHVRRVERTARSKGTIRGKRRRRVAHVCEERKSLPQRVHLRDGRIVRSQNDAEALGILNTRLVLRRHVIARHLDDQHFVQPRRTRRRAAQANQFAAAVASDRVVQRLAARQPERIALHFVRLKARQFAVQGHPALGATVETIPAKALRVARFRLDPEPVISNTSGSGWKPFGSSMVTRNLRPPISATYFS